MEMHYQHPEKNGTGICGVKANEENLTLWLEPIKCKNCLGEMIREREAVIKMLGKQLAKLKRREKCQTTKARSKR